MSAEMRRIRQTIERLEKKEAGLRQKLSDTVSALQEVHTEIGDAYLRICDLEPKKPRAKGK